MNTIICKSKQAVPRWLSAQNGLVDLSKIYSVHIKKGDPSLHFTTERTKFVIPFESMDECKHAFDQITKTINTFW